MLEMLFGEHLMHATLTVVWVVCFVASFNQLGNEMGSLGLFGTAVLLATIMAFLVWLAWKFLEL